MEAARSKLIFWPAIPVSRNYSWSIYWVIGSVLGIGFTAAHGLTYLATYVLSPVSDMGSLLSTLVTIHIIAASLVTWICIWNLLKPPSTGGSTIRLVHRYLGRSAMIIGFVGLTLGFIIAWNWVRRQATTVDSNGNPSLVTVGRYPSSLSIGISIGGVMQFISQVAGWYEITKKATGKERIQAIKSHSFWMTGLFFGGCLVPAIIRLPILLHFEEPAGWASYAWVIPITLLFLHSVALSRKSCV